MVLARFDDLRAGRSISFSAARQVIEAREPHEVRPALDAVQDAVDGGSWAAGMIAYEAAPGLDPTMEVRDPEPGLPLVRFLIADAPDAMTVALPDPAVRGYRLDPWSDDWSAGEHAGRVSRIHEAIAAGETYQVNLTTRRRSRIEGDLLACYRDLVLAQRAPHGSYLDLGRWAVLSGSPESFLHRRGDVVRCVPMKGTAPRGATPVADRALRADLRSSEKERAENVMITDLLRNDLSRIARPGTVEVPELLQVEEYPSVWQLTSTVRAHVDAGLGLADLMAALFPCGSITGAPKISTMRHITRLEDSPRGAYCGALGYLSPARPGVPAETRFSVGIRTLVVDREDGSAVYGVGGGITWASRAAPEWEEIRTKSRLLERLTPDAPLAAAGAEADGTAAPPFALLETLALDEGIPRHLELHLDRLGRSALRFDIPVDRSATRDQVLERADASGPPGAGSLRLLRLAVDDRGRCEVTTREVAVSSPHPVRLAVDDTPRDPQAPHVRHKTSDRRDIDAALERARSRCPTAEDVVLRGRDGRITETSIAHVVLRLDGTWFTPPLEDGCLDGIGRRLVLESGRVVERPLTVADLCDAEEVALISSVRGWRPAVLAEEPSAQPS